MRWLDTNIFLRYLAKPATEADRIKHQANFGLFQRIRRGDEEVTTCEAVLTEIVYNLVSTRQYHLSHDEAAALLRPLLTLRGLHLPHKRTYLRALDLFAVSPFLDIEDAVSVAHMERLGIREILSYDTDFDRIHGVTRIEPPAQEEQQ